MNKKEEIQQEIERIQRQLASLQEKLKEVDDEVPKGLKFKDLEHCFFVDDRGFVTPKQYDEDSSYDLSLIDQNRFFKEYDYAKLFAKKTQLIADMLYFKYLYDRDYEPDWDSENEQKFCVYYNNKTKKFVSSYGTISEHVESVYFSTWRLADRCADWLNKKICL